MAELDLAPEEYGNWLTPLDAWGYARICVGKDGATQAVWTMLLAGVIRTGAKQWAWHELKSSPYIKPGGPLEIPKSHWQHFSKEGSDFWQGEYARFRVAATQLQGAGLATYWGIRLDPL